MSSSAPSDKARARLTIRDIAASAGVSISTVSRVLNGRPDVSPATREAVLRHVRERGFFRNHHASRLAGARTGLFALAVPFMHTEYFAEIVQGAAEALDELDARFVVCATQHQHDREVSLLGRVMHGVTDGAVMILPSESSDELLRLWNQGYPFVVVDHREPVEGDIPVVAAANWSGARTAVEHLLSLGHRRIAAITGPRGWAASADRLAGYRSALLSAGLTAPPSAVCTSDFTVAGGHRAARELLSTPERPTAIFAFNDLMAVGTIRAAKELGLAVPGDLSVVGFDDVDLAAHITPALATVRQPLQEMGRVAVAQLGRLLDGQAIEASRLELSTRLVIRDSTAPPPE